ncbi:LacI family DNA-binding transcriptional regulator [Sphingopyxis sp.]|jgi:DNA-binding LacI/PurR family transcriptional regulator|uniref:LacI family DNA-binding transcriptional regulator n=1 Tax=Sphingopyxis sp. TaxID=1908224 RepID=UPI003D6D0A6E
MARRSTQAASEGTDKAKPVTSYDVAREAGVSQSAVSRYFTPGASVSARTRAKILKAVNKLGYQPNAIARSLITRRSSLVAVVVANLGFNPEFTSILGQSLSARGLNTLLFTLDHESDADHVIDQLWQYRVAGVVAAVTLPPRHVDMLSQREIPLVFVNRAYEEVPVNSVSCDQSEGERWLVDELCAAGHRRIAIVSGPEDSPVSRQRVSSAAERLANAGVKPVEIVVADFTYQGGREAMRKLAAGPARPDAIICANDMLAIGCMDEARHALGLRIPEDISIVGFDGSAPGQWASYDLVTIRQPTNLMVDAAIDMLMARIDDPQLITEKRVFSGELVRGASARLTDT